MKRTLIVAGAFAAGLVIAPNAMADSISQDIGVGTVTASGDPATQSGYIVADGNGANGAPSGYIGASSDEGVVGCWTGDYDPAGGNNVIVGNPPEAPAIPPETGGACSPG